MLHIERPRSKMTLVVMSTKSQCDRLLRRGVLPNGSKVRAPGVEGSVAGGLADLVVHLGEGLLTAELVSQSAVEPPVKHLPELLSVHVHICIQHLEPGGAGLRVNIMLQGRIRIKIVNWVT